MKFTIAPMEGITGYVYRQTLNKYFGEGIDRFYSPFIVPHEKRALSPRDISNICPEHNEGLKLIPQILTNSAAGFLNLVEEIEDLGYREVNLNLGCPSKTVTSKGRGSGFLKRRDELGKFLDEIYAKSSLPISIKTRIGYEYEEEWEDLLELYNRYPVKELIVHLRLGIEMYKGSVHIEAFKYAVSNAKMPLGYNGDIVDMEDYVNLMEKAGVTNILAEAEQENKVTSVMIGRGVLTNPALIRELSGGKPLETAELKPFLDEMLEGYRKEMSGETPVLFKMKELWAFMEKLFPEDEKICKKIKKSKSLGEYEAYVNELF